MRYRSTSKLQFERTHEHTAAVPTVRTTTGSSCTVPCAVPGPAYSRRGSSNSSMGRYHEGAATNPTELLGPQTKSFCSGKDRVRVWLRSSLLQVAQLLCPDCEPLLFFCQQWQRYPNRTQPCSTLRLGVVFDERLSVQVRRASKEFKNVATCEFMEVAFDGDNALAW